MGRFEECIHTDVCGSCGSDKCKYYCPCEESLEFDEEFDAKARDEFYDEWFQYLDTYYTEF